MSADLNVINQWLRDFTVKIQDVRGKEPKTVGTGIAVSMDGKIVTCAHVAKHALGQHPRHADSAEIGVYFAQAVGSEQKSRRAKVIGVFPQHDDDVVLLQLVDGATPLAPEQIAVLGKGDISDGDAFQSYGYRRLAKYHVAFADGQIVGSIEKPETEILHIDPLQLDSDKINGGMSGAAVLDVRQNLVVGIISQRWETDDSADRDAAFGVNARVLSLDPLNLPLYEGELPYPRRAAPQPLQDAPKNARPASGHYLENAPDVLPEWVGRADLLKQLTEDYNDPACRVVALVGFGGEGKTSLARRWIAEILGDIPASQASPKPDRVFWWSFYERRSSDEFFEAALKFVAGEEIAAHAQSAAARAQIIAALLREHRYLFVLDGFEVMQEEEGDRYGLLRSTDLRDFLQLFAAPDHRSFCLLTSRAPALDLMHFTTVRQRDVTRLSPADGRALLREQGIIGTDAALDQVVETWDGHALTLGLIGSYLKERFDGDVDHIHEIPTPTSGEDRYQRVQRVLRRYDEHLTDAERAFLKLFSAFRLPVKKSAFDRVFRTATDPDALNAPLTVLDDTAFYNLVARLADRRLIRATTEAGDLAYTAHPLVRAHYSHLLENEHAAKTAHRAIADFYQADAPEPPSEFDLYFGRAKPVTLDDLKPYIEIVHHLCRAGAHDEAWDIHWDKIYQGQGGILVYQLGAYETDLQIHSGYFPDFDLSQEPLVSQPSAKSFILNEIGLCLMNLGHMNEAPLFYERANQIKLTITQDWRNASNGYRNLAELYVHLGALPQSATAASEALALAGRVVDKMGQKWEKCHSLVRLARTLYLLGVGMQSTASTLQPDPDENPAMLFAQAETLQREIDSHSRYLYSLSGICHADHLRRTGQPVYARRVTEANLEICQRNGWSDNLSQCHRVLGDLDADAGAHDAARDHYDKALQIARNIQNRAVLIEALLARGRWYACYMKDAPAAFSDLNEGLNYAIAGGYRIYEADIRVALAWAHFRNGDAISARAEAARAKSMSAEMGYYWGQVDAEEVLAAL